MIAPVAESPEAVQRRIKSRNGRVLSVTESMTDQKAAYDMAQPSRNLRMRTIPSDGAGADYHLGSDGDVIRRIETALDVARNDVVIGSAIRGVVANVLQAGVMLDPETGSAELDAELSSRWKAYSESPEACDADGQEDFHELAQIALEAVITEGDHLWNLTSQASIEALEAYRLRSPSRSSPLNNRIVYGVEYPGPGEARRPVRYWITQDDTFNSNRIHRKNLTPLEARDKAGNKLVLHLFRKRRKSQTRGVSALAPISAVASMHDDINFAKLVQQQIVSCYSILRERQFAPPGKAGSKPRNKEGEQEFDVRDATGWGRLLESLYPGKEYIGAEGEVLKGFSPNVPNVEYFDHVRLMLTYIAINLDIPLIVLLMDASETNFSGWRGAWDQAKVRLQRWQDFCIKKMYRPVYLWQVRRWLAEDPALRELAEQPGVKVFGHKWQPPTWPYIQPLDDVQADVEQVRKCHNSMRRIQQSRGRDWPTVANEIITDNELIIVAAMDAARRIKGRFQEFELDWREVLSLPTPDSASTSYSPMQAAMQKIVEGGNRGN